MQFSCRSSFEPDSSAWVQAGEQLRQRGDGVDLTVSNPTLCGFQAGVDLAALAGAGSRTYTADPQGSLPARAAIAQQYYAATHGTSVDPADLLLTASTSEGYGFLFQLLCDAGDSVLVPEPCYPLFPMLAQLSQVGLETYRLQAEDGWSVDEGSLEAARTERTRAVMVVHPNNPTGHCLSSRDLDLLEGFCARHGLALIVDEVFLDATVEGPPPVTVARCQPRCLTVVLSGLSKVLALPQMKLGWLLLRGPAGLVEEARHRLVNIADAALSVNTPVQQALPGWLGAGEPIRAEIGARCRQNLREFDRVAKATGGQLSRRRLKAGWSLPVRLPAFGPDVEMAARLAAEARVLVQPGSLYGLPRAGWCVMSLLPRPEVFATGIERLAQFLGQPYLGSQQG